MFGVIFFRLGVDIRVFEDTNTFDGPKDTDNLIVNLFLGQIACFHFFMKNIGMHPAGWAGHFVIEATSSNFLCVSAHPVRNYHTVKAPLTLQHIVQKVAVLASPGAVDFVVARHDRPRFRFLNGHSKGGQIDLP